jgi:hypothetical protein
VRISVAYLIGYYLLYDSSFLGSIVPWGGMGLICTTVKVLAAVPLVRRYGGRSHDGGSGRCDASTVGRE